MEVGSRILVTVTGCGVLSMSMFFTDYKLHSMSREGGVLLNQVQLYGEGASMLLKYTEEKYKHRKLAY